MLRPPCSRWASAQARSSTSFQFGTFQKLFPGLKYEAPYLTYWVVGMCVYILAAWMLAFFYLRNGAARNSPPSTFAGEGAAPVRKRTPYYTYIVPIFPVIMILVLKWRSFQPSSSRSCWRSR
jgi:hypothetical protein